MGVLALQLVELAEVLGGGASERGHILDEDHSSPKDVEVHRVPLQRGGPQIIKGLCDERHLGYFAAALEAAWFFRCEGLLTPGHTTHSEQKVTFHKSQMTLQEPDLWVKHYTPQISHTV